MAPFMRRAVALATSAGLATGVAACSGRSDDPPATADLAAGKRAFLIKCGSCHTLNRAGTHGTQGPNLDEAFQRDVANGLGRGGIRGIVKYQIKHAIAKPTDPSAYMPRNLVQGGDVDNVAAYVASVVGKKGRDQGALFGKFIPDGTNGKLIFQGMCRSCHTLADAGTSGSIGPDLDQVLPGQPVEAIKQSIAKPAASRDPAYRPGIMPVNYASQLTPAQLQALAEYLQRVAGKKRPAG